MIRRRLPGPFVVEDLGHARWKLAGAGAAIVYLRIVGQDTATSLTEPTITRLDIEWKPDGVSAASLSEQGLRRLEVDSVIVHETQEQLYAALPLAEFGPDARRFWRRVFILIRVPGGRWLLRAIAKRRR